MNVPKAKVRVGALLLAAASLVSFTSACTGKEASPATLAPGASVPVGSEPQVIVGDSTENPLLHPPKVDVKLSDGSNNEETAASTVPVAIGTPIDDARANEVLSGPPPVTATTAPAASQPPSADTTAPPVEPGSTSAPGTTGPTSPSTPSSSTPASTTPTTPTSPPGPSTSTTVPNPTGVFPSEFVPPPAVGNTISNRFPPDGVAAPSEPAPTGPLKVVRYAPDGDVAVAPYVTVTFNQPMVPLATLAQLTATDVPVTIEPATAGRWRWVGAQTLRFEVIPDLAKQVDRLPGATEYTVTVSPDATSASGQRLGQAVTWTFSTPPPTVVTVAHADSSTSDPPVTETQPVFVAVFDQRVDPSSVITKITLTAAGKPTGVQLASDDEVKADELAEATVAAAAEGRAVAFRPSQPLPTDSAVTIKVAAETPSAEGPLTTTSEQIFHARTYGPLELTDAECTDDGCHAGTGFSLRFSNPIETEGLDANDRSRLVTISPWLPGATISIQSYGISITGRTAPRTDYKVTVSADLADTFGQQLDAPVTKTFSVTDARTQLVGPDRPSVITDPGNDRPGLTITTVNHSEVKLKVWAVKISEYENFLTFRDTYGFEVSEPSAPTSEESGAPEDWKLLTDTTLDIEGDRNAYVETFIDLNDDFAEAGAQLVVAVEPVKVVEDDWLNRPIVVWVQNTTLAIDAVFDGQQLFIWTTELMSGKPVGNVPVELIGDGRVVTTDGEGTATIALTAETTGLFANAGERVSFLPGEQWYLSEDEGSRTYIFTDRDVYKPGDSVRLTGWMRDVVYDSNDKLKSPGGGRSITWTATDGIGNEIGNGNITTNDAGGFNLDVLVPTTAALGVGYISFSDGNTQFSQTVRIDQYRTPQFEATVSANSAGPHFSNEPTGVTVNAAYYSGGPLANADVEWLVGTSETSYSPPGRDTFTFGIAPPFWAYYRMDYMADYDSPFGPDETGTTEQFTGSTNGAGQHTVNLTFPADADVPVAVSAEATVSDLNRQSWSGNTDLIVHPADAYVGLRMDEQFIELDQPINVDAIVTDIDGAAVADLAVVVTIGRVEYGGDRDYTGTVVDPVECSFQSVIPDEAAPNAPNPMTCTTTPTQGGEYRITAVVTDSSGRHNRTELTRWVAGGDRVDTTNLDVTQDQVTILPDRTSYQPGDTARLLIAGPWAPGHGVLTVNNAGNTFTKVFEFDESATIVEVPVTDAMIPSALVGVELVGSVERTDSSGQPIPNAPPRPAYATGEITLDVPPGKRTLTVDAKPANEVVKPGEQTAVNIRVTDANGAPVVGADVAIAVVDDAVLALSGYQIANPIETMYQPFTRYTNATYARSLVQLANPVPPADKSGLDDESAGDGASATTTASSGYEGAPTAESPTVNDASRDFDTQSDGPADRSNFTPLAVYVPHRATGPDGLTQVEFTLPDNLTRYRIIAVAAAGDTNFGAGESTLTARLPLQVQPSAPRILRVGDAVEFPVLVQNGTDQPVDVDVAIEANGLAFTAGIGQRVTVPANNRVEVRFPANVTEAGQTSYRVAISNADGSQRDAATGKIPVYTPATSESFATYGTIDTDGESTAIEQPADLPANVFANYGGVEVSTSSTLLQQLTDAVLYVNTTDFDSADTVASRLITNASLADIVAQFNALDVPNPAAIQSSMRGDAARLADLQLPDGGWSNWRYGDVDPWTSVRAVHALVAAQQAGVIGADAPALTMGLDFLTGIADIISSDYSPRAAQTVEAYAIAVQRWAGRDASDAAAELYRKDDLEVDALALIWPSIDDRSTSQEIARRINNRATDTAGGVTFTTGYDEGDYLIAASDQRTDAIVLDALMERTPDSDLIVKTVTALLGARRNGRWNNIEDNAFAVTALRHYYDKYETAVPAFTSRAWVGNTFVLDHAFSGRSTDVVSIEVPFGAIDTGGQPSAPIIVQNEGTGRMYYRLGITYAPTDLNVAPRDEGFIIERSYEAISDPADVTRDADGTWRVRPGAPVRVRITMVADSQRTNVALTDPLPAGFEAVNPSFAVSQTFLPDSPDAESGSLRSIDYWPGWSWFDYQDLRDDRAEAYTSLLSAGSYEYTYVARATTPGTFVAPPTKAEDIYQPETFGRSSTDRVVIG